MESCTECSLEALYHVFLGLEFCLLVPLRHKTFQSGHRAEGALLTLTNKKRAAWAGWICPGEVVRSSMCIEMEKQKEREGKDEVG